MDPSIVEELQCPITLTWLENPISLPCCGRAICRDPMIQHLNRSSNCPLCRTDLSSFGADRAPVLINIAYLVEQVKRKELEQLKSNVSSVSDDPEPTFLAKLHQLSKRSVYQTRIGQLEIISLTTHYQTKLLLIPVIDISGSMAGSAINQAKYSLERIVDTVYDHDNILSTIITYHDRANAIDIDIRRPKIDYMALIKNITSRGGTVFKSAFKEIVSTLEKYASNVNITNAIIIFLTDGEDNSRDRVNLPNLLRTDIITEFGIVTIPFTLLASVDHMILIF